VREGLLYHSAAVATSMTLSGSPQSKTADDTVDLLLRARSGDREALDLLFARQLPLLRRWASGRLPRWARDAADTSDLVQQTIVGTLKNLHGFEPRGEGALQAYLRQAAINQVRKALRKASTRPAASELESHIVDEGTSPLEAAIGQETLQRYETSLERLTIEERDAVVGRVELGLTYSELASALDKPSADAARMAVARALVKLAREMNRVAT
jgi:RNA polymerase sigma-70 factor, ECF subfamily